MNRGSFTTGTDIGKLSLFFLLYSLSMVILSEANESRYESLNYMGAGGKA